MNMHKKIGWAAVLLTFMLAACGGDGPGLAGGRNGPGTDPGGEDPGGENPGGPVAAVTSVELLASSTQMLSDGSTPVTLTAIAKDANNRALPEVDIAFAATSGTLQVANATTDEQGVATATLITGGDPTNRTITVSASVGTLSDEIDIRVTGSAINIQGPSSLVSNAKGTYAVILQDAAGKAIAGRTVQLSSANGNTLSATTADTDATGHVQFQMTATNSGTDTLTATALPDASGTPSVAATLEVRVSDDNFRFTTPTAAKEIPLGQNETVVLHWDKNGTNQAGKTINFATTRGTVSATQQTTDGSGDATITVSANTAGPGVIMATAADEGISAELPVEFVATVPDQVFLQTEPGIIGPGESSTITAVVLDPANNRVKNKRVTFTLEDNSGGRLSAGFAITDSLGRAQTVYTASNSSSGFDSVKITGAVEGTLISETVNLTVADRSLHIRFGTGNTIEETDDDTSYIKRYSLFVTDAAGTGVPNATVNLGIRSTHYLKGQLAPGTETWGYAAGSPLVCDSEDLNEDGINDNEDLNGDGELTPGNVAVIMPGSITTDENGRASFSVEYPQNYAWWVAARITAIATVAGTESRSHAIFDFPASADDMKVDGTPPNVVSPFGIDTTTCTNPD